MMKQAIFLWLLAVPIGSLAFAPLAPTVTTTKLVLSAQKTSEDNWITQTFDNMHEFFDKLSGVKKETEKKNHDDSWISDELELIAAEAESDKDVTEKESLEDYWIAQDMTQAGKGEGEVDDWVARDMEKLGRDQVKHDLKLDLEESVGAPNHQVMKKRDTKTPKMKSSEDIERDMKATGKEVGGTPMENLGGKQSFAFQDDKTLRAMKKQKKDTYNDVYKDMEKMGKASSQDWIAQDMAHTGEDNSRVVHSDGADDNYSYKMDKVQDIVDHYNYDEITKDMKQAGSKSQDDWIRRDMQEAGKSHDNVRAALHPSKKNLSSFVPSDIREDMEHVGQLDHDTWIAQDMEIAGHADEESKSSKNFQNVKSFRDEEAKQVMAMRKSILVEGPEEKPEVEVGDETHKKTIWELVNVRSKSNKPTGKQNSNIGDEVVDDHHKKTVWEIANVRSESKPTDKQSSVGFWKFLVDSSRILPF